MTKTLTCTECGSGTLHPATWESDFRHGDVMLHVADLECYRCNMCGADPVFTDQIRRNQLKIADAKRVHDGLLTGAQIRAVRERLGLTQSQASEVFGGGANAFSKYERGDVMQSVAMDRLLKVADFVPGVMDFLRIEAGIVPAGWVTGAGYVQAGSIGISQAQLQSVQLSGQGVCVRFDDYRERRRA
ncbi:type II toxin-antitoxin system MqsA family antitoxin [Marilutibacter spongiae]|uniref:Type II toxin-antitoxin system MqsA family antitoxin n=1 Tax=Marilutibacter spongiae TaxID=2025720 RepID=A0A7W3Y7I3_9GAMM|nr:type II toxin-antitoxin system MqsA family antitoxin [Lysobacter spongiae]MBB1062085.1 type II toxin-antitoxin system MqsA family antitoxin [Lysobacter spongiae]